jgi:hypothetical protein
MVLRFSAFLLVFFSSLPCFSPVGKSPALRHRRGNIHVEAGLGLRIGVLVCCFVVEYMIEEALFSSDDMPPNHYVSY